MVIYVRHDSTNLFTSKCAKLTPMFCVPSHCSRTTYLASSLMWDVALAHAARRLRRLAPATPHPFFETHPCVWKYHTLLQCPASTTFEFAYRTLSILVVKVALLSVTIVRINERGRTCRPLLPILIISRVSQRFLGGSRKERVEGSYSAHAYLRGKYYNPTHTFSHIRLHVSSRFLERGDLLHLYYVRMF